VGETREPHLDVAQTLYGERGVAGVSAARNPDESRSPQYDRDPVHFGSREGLFEGADRTAHARNRAIQQAIYDDMLAAGRDNDPRSLWRCSCGRLRSTSQQGPSETGLGEDHGDFGQAPDLWLNEMCRSRPRAPEDPVRSSTNGSRARFLLRSPGNDRGVGPDRGAHVRDRARLEDDPTESRSHVPDRAFVENLVDMVDGRALRTAERRVCGDRIGVPAPLTDDKLRKWAGDRRRAAPRIVRRGLPYAVAGLRSRPGHGDLTLLRPTCARSRRARVSRRAG